MPSFDSPGLALEELNACMSSLSKITQVSKAYLDNMDQLCAKHEYRSKTDETIAEKERKFAKAISYEADLVSMFSQLAAQGANSWQSISMSGGINDLENEDHSQERQVVEDATAFRQYIASYSAAALRATALSELVERSLVYKYNTLHGHSDHEEEVELGPEHESAFATLLDSMKNLSVDELVKLMIESGKGTKGPDLTQTEAEESVPAEEPLLKEVLEKIEGVTERANAEEKAEGEDDQKKKDDVEGDEAKESQDA